MFPGFLSVCCLQVSTAYLFSSRMVQVLEQSSWPGELEEGKSWVLEQVFVLFEQKEQRSTNLHVSHSIESLIQIIMSIH